MRHLQLYISGTHIFNSAGKLASYPHLPAHSPPPSPLPPELGNNWCSECKFCGIHWEQHPALCPPCRDKNHSPVSIRFTVISSSPSQRREGEYLANQCEKYPTPDVTTTLAFNETPFSYRSSGSFSSLIEMVITGKAESSVLFCDCSTAVNTKAEWYHMSCMTRRCPRGWKQLMPIKDYKDHLWCKEKST